MTTNERMEKENTEREARARFRRVFSSPDGKLVLASILLDLRYFGEAKNEADTALKNYATTLVRDRIGIQTKEQGLDVVQALLGIGQ